MVIRFSCKFIYLLFLISYSLFAQVECIQILDSKIVELSGSPVSGAIIYPSTFPSFVTRSSLDGTFRTFFRDTSDYIIIEKPGYFSSIVRVSNIDNQIIMKKSEDFFLSTNADVSIVADATVLSNISKIVLDGVPIQDIDYLLSQKKIQFKCDERVDSILVAVFSPSHKIYIDTIYLQSFADLEAKKCTLVLREYYWKDLKDNFILDMISAKRINEVPWDLFLKELSDIRAQIESNEGTKNKTQTINLSRLEELIEELSLVLPHDTARNDQVDMQSPEIFRKSTIPSYDAQTTNLFISANLGYAGNKNDTSFPKTQFDNGLLGDFSIALLSKSGTDFFYNYLGQVSGDLIGYEAVLRQRFNSKFTKHLYLSYKIKGPHFTRYFPIDAQASIGIDFDISAKLKSSFEIFSADLGSPNKIAQTHQLYDDSFLKLNVIWNVRSYRHLLALCPELYYPFHQASIEKLSFLIDLFAFYQATSLLGVELNLRIPIAYKHLPLPPSERNFQAKVGVSMRISELF